MAKFRFNHDLNSLSENEIAEYLRGVSEYFKADPDLNLFDTIWMNSEDGVGRKRVVYARRGTCEILREIHGIAIGASTKEDGPGYVSFHTVAIKMSTGRQEIGVGVHSIGGLTGQKLADAVMTAHTRSTRRATLQVVGGGILDVSEVNPQAVDNVAHTASLAQLAGSPTVLPPPRVTSTPFVPKPIVFNEQECVIEPHELPGATQADPVVPIQADSAPKPRKPRRKRNTVDIASPGQEPVQTEMPVGQIDKNGQITPLAEPLPPIQHSDVWPCEHCAALDSNYLKKGPPPTAPLAMPSTIIDPAVLNVAAEINERAVEQLKKTTDLAVPPDTAKEPEKGASANGTLPTPSLAATEKANYRERSAKYSQDILPKAGMVPSPGIGGVTMKLRKFATTFSGLPDGQSLNPEQSEDLFEFMDGFTAKNGAVALVEYINKAIGVTN